MNVFFFLVVFSSAAEAVPMALDKLTSFADEQSYRDNRASLIRDKQYSASKGCCSATPWSVLEAYAMSKDATFNQVALWCDQCGTRSITPEQIQLCRSELARLYQKLFDKELPASQSALVGTDHKESTDAHSGPRIRFSTGNLKCDSKGGRRVRIDFLNRK